MECLRKKQPHKGGVFTGVAKGWYADDLILPKALINAKSRVI